MIETTRLPEEFIAGIGETRYPFGPKVEKRTLEGMMKYNTCMYHLGPPSRCMDMTINGKCGHGSLTRQLMYASKVRNTSW